MTNEPKIPQSLRDQLQAGKVIPFVGAGVSMAVKGKDGKGLFRVGKICCCVERTGSIASRIRSMPALCAAC